MNASCHTGTTAVKARLGNGKGAVAEEEEVIGVSGDEGAGQQLTELRDKLFLSAAFARFLSALTGLEVCVYVCVCDICRALLRNTGLFCEI